ncbi:hypothetical protein Tsubulata_019748, partial [Turnera subulata]
MNFLMKGDHGTNFQRLVHAQLSSDFYEKTCPKALFTIKKAVLSAVAKEHRMGASLLRLHFHDCFGCDASVLLNDTSSFTGEKTAGPNLNSIRGFDVIDSIKAQLETVCPGLGGPSWTVLLGRRDSTTASFTTALNDLPSPLMDLSDLISAFSNKGFTVNEMVALSGSHTTGQSRCLMFRNRVHNETNMDSTLATSLKSSCPISGSDDNLSPLDASSPVIFDNAYFKNLVDNKGLLHSDQQLFSGGSTDSQVTTYSNNPITFYADFARAMVKMGNLSPLTGSDGQIRTNCAKAVEKEPRMGASLLRMHFHDCFVNGCDGSVLLDDNATFIGEKTAFPNINSLRGFEVVDDIKSALNKACGNVVSCADILTLAASYSVNLLGGPSWAVRLGRGDSKNASWFDANTNLPAPFLDLSQLLESFVAQGLDLKDLVVLSGGHTIGKAQCVNFINRANTDPDIDPAFAASVRMNCTTDPANIDKTQPLDGTTTKFDTQYYKGLLASKGLLHSDQQLYQKLPRASDALVIYYSWNPLAFEADFANSMIKMGNIKPKPITGPDGEVRMNCRR